MKTPTLEAILEEAFDRQALLHLTLSDRRIRAEESFRKVTVKPVQLKGEVRFQCEYHFEKKVTHRNLTPEEAKTHVATLLAETFRQAFFQTATADVRVIVGKEGQATVQTRPPTKQAAALSHDRLKQYLLADGQPIPFLVRLGVMNAQGKVIAAKYDKFRQINRFLEMAADVLDALEPGKPLSVVDFGCGKAYLTFALYHFLRATRGMDPQIRGVDVKREVLEECRSIAADLGYTGLTFEVGTIRASETTEPVDVVVALHACNTATDDALIQAVAWSAKVILAVPCCQHELLKQLDNSAMRPMLKHGLARERLSALVTDSLRAAALEAAGYSVQMLEFVETEHTPKNLLLRALRQEHAPNRARALEEYRAFRDYWHVHPAIEAVLH